MILTAIPLFALLGTAVLASPHSLTTRQNSNGDPFACYEVRESAGRNYMILNNPWGLGARGELRILGVATE